MTYDDDEGSSIQGTAEGGHNPGPVRPHQAGSGRGADRRGPAAGARRRRGRWMALLALPGAVAGGWLLASAPAAAFGPAFMAEAADTGGSGGGGDGRDRDFMGRRLERILDHLQATEPQKQQLRALFLRVGPELRAVRAERRQVKAAMMRAFAAEPIDRGAIEKLRQEGVRNAERTSALWARVAVEAGQILTPAQRQKVVEHLARRGGGHGRGQGRGPF